MLELSSEIAPHNIFVYILPAFIIEVIFTLHEINHLKYTIWWDLAYSQYCTTIISMQFQTFLLFQKGNSILLNASHLFFTHTISTFLKVLSFPAFAGIQNQLMLELKIQKKEMRQKSGLF